MPRVLPAEPCTHSSGGSWRPVPQCTADIQVLGASSFPRRLAHSTSWWWTVKRWPPGSGQVQSRTFGRRVPSTGTARPTSSSLPSMSQGCRRLKRQRLLCLLVLRNRVSSWITSCSNSWCRLPMSSAADGGRGGGCAGRVRCQDHAAHRCPKGGHPSASERSSYNKNVCKYGLLSKLVKFLVRQSSFHKNECSNGLVFKVQTIPPHKLCRLQ